MTVDIKVAVSVVGTRIVEPNVITSVDTKVANAVTVSMGLMIVVETICGGFMIVVNTTLDDGAGRSVSVTVDGTAAGGNAFGGGNGARGPGRAGKGASRPG